MINRFKRVGIEITRSSFKVVFFSSSELQRDSVLLHLSTAEEEVWEM